MTSARIRNGALFLILALALALTLDSRAARLSTADSEPEEKKSSGSQAVTVNFQDVDIKVIADFISRATGKNFIFDRQVQGKVTVVSPSPVTPQEAYQLFESVLEVNGFTTVPSGKFIKIIPASQAKSKAIETRDVETPDRNKQDRVVTQLVRLQHANAGEVRKLIAPFLDKTGVAMAYEVGNLLILTDYASNIARLLNIIKAVDTEGEGLQLMVVQLKHASARNMAEELDQLIKMQGRTPSAPQPQQQFSIVADDRTNTLIVLHRPEHRSLVEDLIAKLDTPTPTGVDKVHVYFLENARAEDLAQILSNLAGGAGTGAAAVPAGAQGGAAGAQRAVMARQIMLQEPVTIVADKATNALIIRAEAQDYQLLKTIIEKLDVQRAQVLVEGLIMELTFSKSLQLGAEWRVLDQPDSGSNALKGFGGTNLPVGADSQGLLNQMAVNPLTSGAAGLVLGAARGTLSFGGATFLNLGLLVHALQSDTDVNILSTPHLLTMDNEEASIIVGEERPFLKSAVTNTASTDLNVTRTFDFKDLGITLKITPHISQGAMVKLNVFLQIKDFVAEAETGAVTSTKRETTTTVVVSDGETVVIGGLIRDNTRAAKTAVPCLGQIPVLGWLFKAKGNTGDKTNLLILLTPTIVRSTDRLRELTDERRKKIEEEQRKFREGRKVEEIKRTLKVLTE
jgi:general secretion pathway protein D